MGNGRSNAVGFRSDGVLSTYGIRRRLAHEGNGRARGASQVSSQGIRHHALHASTQAIDGIGVRGISRAIKHAQHSNEVGARRIAYAPMRSALMP